MEDRSAKRNEGAAALQGLMAVPWEGRAILLVDLDAFFASVEQLDHPAWRGKPVIVGGEGSKRGVVSTASYEARRFGVHSAMASSVAERLCPDAIWTSGNFARYREVSDQIMAILLDETPHVQQVSIDEAFMDVTPTKVNREHPVAVALRIQERVAKLGVTCSIGVGTSKSIAKIASEADKPRGLTVVMPGSELNFIGPMPVSALSGVGPSSQRTLKAMAIETLGDLYHADDEAVIARLGKAGRTMLQRVRGLEDDTVSPEREVKSVSGETSFAVDMTERRDIQAAIDTMAAKVARRLRKKGLRGSTLTLKVRYGNLSVRSCQVQLPRATDDAYLMEEHLHSMLDELWEPGMALRLVGVAMAHFDEEDAFEQLSLFPEPKEEGARQEVQEAHRDLQGAADRVKDRFGEGALVFGRELRLKGTSTGSSSKNPADYR